MFHTYTHYLLAQGGDDAPDPKRISALVRTLLQKPFVSVPGRFEIFRHETSVFARSLNQAPEAPHLQPSPGQTLQLTFYRLLAPAWTEAFSRAGLGETHGLTLQVGYEPFSLKEKHWVDASPAPTTFAIWLLCRGKGVEVPPNLEGADSTLELWSSILGCPLAEFGAYR